MDPKQWKTIKSTGSRLICCVLDRVLLLTVYFSSTSKAGCAAVNMVAIMTIRGVAICECPDDHAFWPPDGRCYEVYTRGPCSSDEIFVHNRSTQAAGTSNHMECVKNPCPGEKKVLWKDGKCYDIGNNTIM
jgi:hypothetical protein